MAEAILTPSDHSCPLPYMTKGPINYQIPLCWALYEYPGIMKIEYCGLHLPVMGESRGSSAGQLRGECGTSSALVRRKWVEPRLAALVGPEYVRDQSSSLKVIIKIGILSWGK